MIARSEDPNHTVDLAETDAIEIGADEVEESEKSEVEIFISSYLDEKLQR